MEVERVQRCFLRLIGIQYVFLLPKLSHWSECRTSPSTSLEAIQFLQDVMFVHKLLNNKMVCSDLLKEINTKQPGKTRSTALFDILDWSMTYMQHSPMKQVERHCNELPDTNQILGTNTETFWRHVLKYIHNQQFKN